MTGLEPIIFAIAHFMAGHAVLTAYVVALAYISYQDYIAWMTNQNIDSNSVAFAIAGAVQNGKFVVKENVLNREAGRHELVQGVFDRNKGRVTTMRAIHAKKMEHRIIADFEKEPLIIYT